MAACEQVPGLLSSFVDTFVDFTVSGFFLLPDSDADDTFQSSSRFPDAGRVVAIGDLHGDLQKTRDSFRLADLIDASDRWIGGSTTVVQIGDVLDRGSDELRILYFLEKLRRDAGRSGGRVITMNGNHEIMNVDADFRFVTRGGLEEFESWARWYSVGRRMKNSSSDLFEGIPASFAGVKEELWAGFRARIAALRARGPVTRRFLARNVTAAVVGETVFVHGGLLAEHAEYGLDRMNEEVREWMREGSGRATFCRGRKAVVWLRSFSEESEEKCDCEALEHALETIPGARRMVMGHTIQRQGINSACHGRALRIDVGMSSGCADAPPQVLQILHSSRLSVLSAPPLHASPSLRTYT